MIRPVKFDVAPPRDVAAARLDLLRMVVGVAGLEEHHEELAELAKGDRPGDITAALRLAVRASRRGRR